MLCFLGGKCPEVRCPWDKFLKGKTSGDNCLGGKCPEGECPGCERPRVKVRIPFKSLLKITVKQWI